MAVKRYDKALHQPVRQTSQGDKMSDTLKAQDQIGTWDEFKKGKAMPFGAPWRFSLLAVAERLCIFNLAIFGLLCFSGIWISGMTIALASLLSDAASMIWVVRFLFTDVQIDIHKTFIMLKLKQGAKIKWLDDDKTE